MNDELEQLLNHTVYKDGPGPNKSGGEWQVWRGGETTTLKSELEALIQQERQKAAGEALEGVKQQVLNELKQIIAKAQDETDKPYYERVGINCVNRHIELTQEKEIRAAEYTLDEALKELG